MSALLWSVTLAVIPPFQLPQKSFVVDRFDDARIDHRGGVVLQKFGTAAAHFSQYRLHTFKQRIGQSGIAPLLGDQPIRQFVFIVGLARKMSGEDVAAALDGLAKCIAGFVRLDAGGDHADDFIPSAGAGFLIDAAIGEHDHAVFKERDKDENARVSFGVVQAVCGKRR
jgi:hypothetical protein